MIRNGRISAWCLAGLLVALSAGFAAGETPGARRLLLTRVVDGPGGLLGIATSGRVVRLHPDAGAVTAVDLAEPVLDACAASNGGYWLLLENGEKRLVRVGARLQRVAAFSVPRGIWRVAPADGGLWMVPLPGMDGGGVRLYRLFRGGTVSETAVLDPESLGWRFEASDDVRTARTFIDLGAADGRVVLAYRFFPMAVVWEDGHQRLVSLAKIAGRLEGYSTVPSPLVRCVVPAHDDGFWVLPWVTSRDPESGVTLSDRVFRIDGSGDVLQEVPLPGEALAMTRRGEGVVLWMRGASVLRITGKGTLEK